MSPSNHHNRRNHRHPPPTIARSSKYRTICDLPFELLDMVISHVKSDKWTVQTCTLVCHCLRAVSLEHYFRTCLRVSQIGSFDHLFSFLAAYPRICAKTLRLRITGETRKVKKNQFLPRTPLDDTTVLRLMRSLPNLEEFDFCNFVHDHPQEFTPQTAPTAGQAASGPFHLQRLVLGSGYDVLPHKCSISGLFRILSLFVIDELHVDWVKYKLDASAPLNLAYLYRSLEVKGLHMAVGSAVRNCTPTDVLLRAFTESFETGTLRTLDVQYHTLQDVIAIGELLSHGGEGLTSLAVHPGISYVWPERTRWKDPLDSTCLQLSGVSPFLIPYHSYSPVEESQNCYVPQTRVNPDPDLFSRTRRRKAANGWSGALPRRCRLALSGIGHRTDRHDPTI